MNLSYTQVFNNIIIDTNINLTTSLNPKHVSLNLRSASIKHINASFQKKLSIQDKVIWCMKRTKPYRHTSVSFKIDRTKIIFDESIIHIINHTHRFLYNSIGIMIMLGFNIVMSGNTIIDQKESSSVVGNPYFFFVQTNSSQRGNTETRPRDGLWSERFRALYNYHNH